MGCVLFCFNIGFLEISGDVKVVCGADKSFKKYQNSVGLASLFLYLDCRVKKLWMILVCVKDDIEGVTTDTQ